MVFSDPTTEEGLIQEVDRICGSTNNNYSLKAKTARINMGLDRFYAIALAEDEDWLFDDANYTDQPIAVTNLVSGQQDYPFDTELLTVKKVMVKDSAGTWDTIFIVDSDDPNSDPIWELPTSNSGAPRRYALLGSSIYVDPIPNYNSTGGLKVVFQRNASKFVSGDLTKVPGIPSLFHGYLARQGALPFLIEKKLPQKADVAAQILVDEEAIRDFISNRNKTRRTSIRAIHRSAR